MMEDGTEATETDGSLYLVFGASGYIGSNLVPFLQKEGVRVRAAARNIDVLQARDWHGVELAQEVKLQQLELNWLKDLMAFSS